ncbi:25177_t:CDS:2 [Cetraspora pellucida]|uniref:protein O-GlcNAc transferase n=1 Tax=Cetraspora pellucida TaxID=1433469 RepID=A0A9N9H9V9_9GLOM|nr:25177_t:CDS:2 [Cetraspora pellucida]
MSDLPYSPLLPNDPNFWAWLDALLLEILMQHQAVPLSRQALNHLSALNNYYNGFTDIQVKIYGALAQAHELSGNWLEAINAHRNILALRPDNIDAMVGLAKCYNKNGDKTQFLSTSYDVIRTKPTNWEFANYLTDALTNDPSLFQEVLDVLNHVLQHSPNAPIKMLDVGFIQSLFYRRAQLKKRNNDYFGALIDCFSVLEIALNGKPLKSFLDDIILCLGFSNYDPNQVPFIILPVNDSLRLLDLLFPTTNGLFPGHLGLSSQSDIRLAKKQVFGILYEISSAFESHPKECQYFLNDVAPLSSISLLFLYLACACYPSAQIFFEIAAMLNKISGVTACRQAAIGYLGEGIQLDPKNVDAYINLADCLYNDGNITGMTEVYEKLLSFHMISDENHLIRFAFGCCYIGDIAKLTATWSNALLYYKRAHTLRPNDPIFLASLTQANTHVCYWKDRGGIGYHSVDSNGNLNRFSTVQKSGQMALVADIVEKAINDGAKFGKGIIEKSGGILTLLTNLCSNLRDDDKSVKFFKAKAAKWRNQTLNLKNEGGWVLRVIHHIMRRIQHKWYVDSYGDITQSPHALPPINVTPKLRSKYQRPLVPSGLEQPVATPIQPFYTFIYDLDPRQVRIICHRTALNIAYEGCTASWLDTCVFPPPPPPSPRLRVGYVSSDFKDHPLAHLMQSVFGMHDRNIIEVYCYSLSPNDGSSYRVKIEKGADKFYDCHAWTTESIVKQIVHDNIHILVNLNGYTAGDRNLIFAARPAPIQVTHMGFASSLVDEHVCPESQTSDFQFWNKSRDNDGDLLGEVDPEEDDKNWTYPEKIIYMPTTYFINDHKQGFYDDNISKGFYDENIPGCILAKNHILRWFFEEDRRWDMRKQLFPNLTDDWVIFANFNQLYKIDPAIFKLWLRILERVPKSILWILNFPEEGAKNLLETAKQWAGPNIASHIYFTDVADKKQHVIRGRIADLILDTPQVNAHTTACDILWSGTPMITLSGPEHKMCSRVASSICNATGFGDKMVVPDYQAYEDKAVEYANSVVYKYWFGCLLPGAQQRLHRNGFGELIELRKNIYLNRENIRLFDTQQAVKELEKGYVDAWVRWVNDNERNIHIKI